MPPQWVKRLEDGSLVLPAQVCNELGLDRGEAALVEVVDGELRVRPASRAIEPPLVVFRHHGAPDVSLASRRNAGGRRETEAE